MGYALSVAAVMEIFISDIPEEGLLREGTFAAELFDLPEDDVIRASGDAKFSATMYSFDDLVAFTGTLKGSFQLQCSRCLEFVDYEANIDPWSSELDLEEKQTAFDLYQIIREDFLLQLPSHPLCSELVAGRTCAKASLVRELEESADTPLEEERPDVWGALDQLD